MKRKVLGFTIIEVVLVLAIAGLIFLMVFLALPTLQRNQRDTQRRDALGRVASQTQQFMSNNQGRVPTNLAGQGCDAPCQWNSFRLNYLDLANDPFLDPNGLHYYLSYRGDAGANVGNEAISFGSIQVGTDNFMPIRVYSNARCDGENAVFAPNGSRLVAFRMKLEGAGTACRDNYSGTS